MPNSLSRVVPRDIEGRNFFPVNLAGGLNQETSKFSVPPGTLADCLNYNSSTRGYQRAKGLLRYDGTIDAAVQNMWVVGVDDDDASLFGSGFTLGGTVTWGDDSSATCVYYKRVGGSPDYTLLGLVELSGNKPVGGDTLLDSETGTSLVLEPTITYPAATLRAARYPDTGDLICPTITDYLEFINNEVNSDLTAQTGATVVGSTTTYHGEVPGAGRINGGWQYNDKVYVVRDGYGCTFTGGKSEFVAGDLVLVELAGGGYDYATVAKVELTGGLWSLANATGTVLFMPSIYTADFTSLANISGAIWTSDGATTMATIGAVNGAIGSLVWEGTIHGWKFTDTGWSVPFKNGTYAPNVKAAPLFQADLIGSSRNSAIDYPDLGENAGSGSYIAWTNPSNVTSGADVTCTVPDGSLTRYLKCRIEANRLPHDKAKVIGIEIQIESIGAGTNVPQFVHLSLLNETTGSAWYQSANKADLTKAPTSATTRTYGGESDLWGLEEITAADINSGEMYFMIQYYGTGSGTNTITLSDVQYTVYYTTENEKVWFYDGATDVATGEIHAYQIEKGDFGSANSARGKMSFSNLTNPQFIGAGMTMYTEPGGAGLKVADVAQAPSYHTLPCSCDMEAEGSQYQIIRANYYENDESEAVYGVTGAGPAFSFDGENFAFLEAPLARTVDKPRHIAFHENRLALGYKTGHVILSGVGTPNNFSAVDSASSWGVGDRVTGLISLAGNVLGVFSDSSINSLQGSSESTGTMRTISSTTGTREYTVENIAGPYYADNRGITSLDTSDKYGDFDMGRLSDPIRQWVQARLQERRTTETLDTAPAASIALRNKNQYRLFFNDGYILVMYFSTSGSVEPTIMHYDTDNYSTKYVPTWIDSYVLSSGSERVVMGTAEGAVWVVDGANAIQDNGSISTPSAWLTFNPMNFGRPESLHKHFHVVMQGQFFGAQALTTYAANNYRYDWGDDADEVTVGDYSDAPVFEATTNLDATYHSTVTDGFTFKIESTLDGSEPHTFQSLLFRASRKAVDRNAASKSY